MRYERIYLEIEHTTKLDDTARSELVNKIECALANAGLVVNCIVADFELYPNG
jgi:hypothetical protein